MAGKFSACPYTISFRVCGLCSPDSGLSDRIDVLEKQKGYRRNQTYSLVISPRVDINDVGVPHDHGVSIELGHPNILAGHVLLLLLSSSPWLQLLKKRPKDPTEMGREHKLLDVIINTELMVSAITLSNSFIQGSNLAMSPSISATSCVEKKKKKKVYLKFSLSDHQDNRR